MAKSDETMRAVWAMLDDVDELENHAARLAIMVRVLAARHGIEIPSLRPLAPPES